MVFLERRIPLKVTTVKEAVGIVDNALTFVYDECGKEDPDSDEYDGSARQMFDMLGALKGAFQDSTFVLKQ
jgi:hypothetical protein